MPAGDAKVTGGHAAELSPPLLLQRRGGRKRHASECLGIQDVAPARWWHTTMPAGVSGLQRASGQVTVCSEGVREREVGDLAAALRLGVNRAFDGLILARASGEDAVKRLTLAGQVGSDQAALQGH